MFDGIALSVYAGKLFPVFCWGELGFTFEYPVEVGDTVEATCKTDI